MSTATIGWFNPAARFDRVTVLHDGTLVLALDGAWMLVAHVVQPRMHRHGINVMWNVA